VIKQNRKGVERKGGSVRKWVGEEDSCLLGRGKSGTGQSELTLLQLKKGLKGKGAGKDYYVPNVVVDYFVRSKKGELKLLRLLGQSH